MKINNMSLYLLFSIIQEWPGEVKLIDDKFLIFIFILNGFMFYMQSLTAFGLMSLISPVTFRYARFMLLYFLKN